VSGNLERLSFEYRRSDPAARGVARRPPAGPRSRLYGIEGRLEELEQEDAISMRRREVA
jgi:hypothetical protein